MGSSRHVLGAGFSY